MQKKQMGGGEQKYRWVVLLHCGEFTRKDLLEY